MITCMHASIAIWLIFVITDCSHDISIIWRNKYIYIGHWLLLGLNFETIRKERLSAYLLYNSEKMIGYQWLCLKLRANTESTDIFSLIFIVIGHISITKSNSLILWLRNIWKSCDTLPSYIINLKKLFYDILSWYFREEKCTFAHCFAAPMVVVDPALPGHMSLKQLKNSNGVFNASIKMFPVILKTEEEENNFTIIEFPHGHNGKCPFLYSTHSLHWCR